MSDAPLAAYRRVDRAYAQIFGVEGQRTPAQAAVWADLELVGCERRPITPAGSSEPIDPLRLVYNDGKRTVFLHIQERIRRAAEPDETPLPEVLK